MMDQVMRFASARRRDPAVEAWFTAGDPHRLMAQVWFVRLRALGPDVRELLHDGYPVACVGDVAFAYAGAFKAHVNLGFFRGATLPDPGGLLEGEGKRMRHVKLRPGQAVNEKALNALIAAAYKDAKRLAQETPVTKPEKVAANAAKTPRRARQAKR